MGHFEKGRWIEDEPRFDGNDRRPVRLWWTGKPGEPGEWIELPGSVSDAELEAAAERWKQEHHAHIDNMFQECYKNQRPSLFERIMRYFRR
jgi:hypothetical protein